MRITSLFLSASKQELNFSAAQAGVTTRPRAIDITLSQSTATKQKEKKNIIIFISFHTPKWFVVIFFVFFFACIYSPRETALYREGVRRPWWFSFFFLLFFFVGCCLSPSTILLRLGRDSVSVSVVRCLRVRLGCASIQTMPQSTNIFLRRIFRDCFLCCSCFIFAVFVRIVCLLDDSTYFHLSYGLCLFPANGAYAHLIL